ncbi:hypothetical protein DEV92_112100 [Phyllobacterium myrsinacearum]|nr:hypothetical protein DEV92_112100 [Phyllobacterium myrsinacearum]RZV07828.1 hypothetical protein EV654_2505 [Phyllobacterium myrsinacearum]
MCVPESKADLTIGAGSHTCRIPIHPFPQAAGFVTTMLKILPLLLIVLMALHLIKPLGWPGMKKRGDFWKIAAGAIFAMLVVVVLSHSGL